jgi:hypothetical protein
MTFGLTCSTRPMITTRRFFSANHTPLSHFTTHTHTRTETLSLTPVFTRSYSSSRLFVTIQHIIDS